MFLHPHSAGLGELGPLCRGLMVLHLHWSTCYCLRSHLSLRLPDFSLFHLVVTECTLPPYDVAQMETGKPSCETRHTCFASSHHFSCHHGDERNACVRRGRQRILGNE